MKAVQRVQLKDGWRQVFDQTIDAQIDRYLEVSHQGIIGNHYFAAASSECIELYRNGHFISTVMVSQAVNEAILRFLCEKNGISETSHGKQISQMQEMGVLTAETIVASESIWGSFRNDVHHMNPTVASIPFRDLAKRNLQALAQVEGEVFGADYHNGALVPRQPKYWDVRDDGTVEVFLRLE